VTQSDQERVDLHFRQSNLVSLVIWGLWWPAMVWLIVFFGRVDGRAVSIGSFNRDPEEAAVANPTNGFRVTSSL
jgi:hypothetical protein